MPCENFDVTSQLSGTKSLSFTTKLIYELIHFYVMNVVHDLIKSLIKDFNIICVFINKLNI